MISGCGNSIPLGIQCMPFTIYYTNFIMLLSATRGTQRHPEDNSGHGNKHTPPMHARCARKTLSFGKATFYSLEEAIWSMSKRFKIYNESTKYSKYEYPQKSSIQRGLVVLDLTKRRGGHGQVPISLSWALHYSPRSKRMKFFYNLYTSSF